MHTRPLLRATFVLLGLSILATSCGKSGSDPVGTSSNAAVRGVSYDVEVFRPQNGRVTSMDGRIRCGPAAADSACRATFGWSVVVTLTATPATGYAFQQWAGDCSVAGPCVLSTAQYGADKYVVAVFVEQADLAHPNWTHPRDHAPGYYAWLAQRPNTPQCPSCHGVNLQGQGIAPDCFTCHRNAGWQGDWRTNCSFCHGQKTPATQAGYTFASNPAWSAPPQALGDNLTGVPNAAKTGAHQAHMTGVTATGEAITGPWACATCHPIPTNVQHARGVPALVTLSAAGQASLPANLGTYDPISATCTTYCHYDRPVTWTSTVTCDSCHGMPPDPALTGHPDFSGSELSCAACHPDTVDADGNIKVADGKHVNGVKEIGGGGAGCAGCHAFPGQSGAHAAHFGLTGAEETTPYGDLGTLETRSPGATPADAGGAYAFGCGQCHPRSGRHFNGVVDVVLYEANAPAGSLKARNAPTAAYDRATRTCSGVYCHSSGQQAPAYVVTPSWTSSQDLGCAACHANPPRYGTGGAGTTTANSHVGLVDDGYAYGHFLGLTGAWHGSPHGKGLEGRDSSPLTCQTCHFDTTDPANVGPGGFYYLDTTGDYVLEGLVDNAAFRASITCTTCHGPSGGAPAGTGKILPLRHVNGARDVVLDRRTELPALSWFPGAPNAPLAPYWLTQANPGRGWPDSTTLNGETISFSVAEGAYDSATKTCTNVACHLAEDPVWGAPMLFRAGAGIGTNCTLCHR